MGDKAAEQALAALRARNVQLNKLIHGLGTAPRRRKLAERFGHFDAIKEASVDDLAAVEGIGDVIAGSLRNSAESSAKWSKSFSRLASIRSRMSSLRHRRTDLAGKSIMHWRSFDTHARRFRSVSDSSAARRGRRSAKRPTSSSLANSKLKKATGVETIDESPAS